MRPSRRAAVFAAAGLGLLVGCGTDTTATKSNPSASPTSVTATGAGTDLKCTGAPQARDGGAALTLPDKAAASGKTFEAEIQTNCGTITAELFGDKAPQTVASFIALSKGYYTNTPCPRLVTSGIYVVQCGDPTGTSAGNPGYSFGMENAPTDAKYPAGTLAMARGSDPSSNSGQFFFVYQDTEIVDPTGTGYSVFGKVTSGIDILRAVAAKGDDGTSSAGGGSPAQPIGIQKITVTEKKA